jgi:hypothetical protein
LKFIVDGSEPIVLNEPRPESDLRVSDLRPSERERKEPHKFPTTQENPTVTELPEESDIDEDFDTYLNYLAEKYDDENPDEEVENLLLELN